MGFKMFLISLQVPEHKVKLIVGAGGEKIKYIQKKSKCQVQVGFCTQVLANIGPRLATRLEILKKDARAKLQVDLHLNSVEKISWAWAHENTRSSALLQMAVKPADEVMGIQQDQDIHAA